MSELQDDIDFLEEILEKVENNNMHDHLDAMQMLRDQISHMQERKSNKALCRTEEAICQ